MAWPSHTFHWVRLRKVFLELISSEIRKDSNVLEHYNRKKVHKSWAYSQNPSFNTFFKWCWNLKKMMDVGALCKRCISSQKTSKCLNSFSGLIYFLVTCSIFFFTQEFSENLTKKWWMELRFMLPQNFGTKFKIQKKSVDWKLNRLKQSVLEVFHVSLLV